LSNIADKETGTMTRTELENRKAELLSEIDDLGDMYESGLLSESAYREEIEPASRELASVKCELDFCNEDHSAVCRYD